MIGVSDQFHCEVVGEIPRTSYHLQIGAVGSLAQRHALSSAFSVLSDVISQLCSLVASMRDSGIDHYAAHIVYVVVCKIECVSAGGKTGIGVTHRGEQPSRDIDRLSVRGNFLERDRKSVVDADLLRRNVKKSGA